MTFNDENFFDGASLKDYHNGSKKKHGLDKKARKHSKEIREARKNRRTF